MTKKSDKKTKWNVHLPGREPFAMLGGLISRDEAVKAASLIWPKDKVKVS